MAVDRLLQRQPRNIIALTAQVSCLIFHRMLES